MRLIREEINDAQYIIEEVDGGKKNYSIKGIFLQGDLKNRNGRIYPTNVLHKEVTRYNKEFINKNRAFGELGHPEGPTVNLERVSHMIKKLYPEGKNYIGEAKIMDTPYGKIVKNLIDEGAKLGVSSRGMGSLVQKNGHSYVGEDFYLATAADIVADPSAPDAFVEGIMEAKSWIWENGILKEVEMDNWKKELIKTKRLDLAEKKSYLFKDFLNKLDIKF